MDTTIQKIKMHIGVEAHLHEGLWHEHSRTRRSQAELVRCAIAHFLGLPEGERDKQIGKREEEDRARRGEQKA